MALLLVLLFLSCTFPFSNQAKPYNFNPESRHIEINQNDVFSIEFEETANQTQFGHCYIESSTYTADYRIDALPDEKQQTSDTLSGFAPKNNSQICGFTFWTVTDKTPVNWTITAYDNLTQSYFTEIVSVTFYYNMPIYLDKTTVLPTAGIANYLKPGNATKLKKCTLGFDDVTVGLDMNTVKTYNGDNVFKSRLASLGNGKCGYRINNLALGESKELILYATDDADKKYRSITTLVVIPDKSLQNQTMEVYLGDSLAAVYCGPTSLNSALKYEEKFCHFYNPQGDLVSRDTHCAYRLDIVTKEDLGTWKCEVGYDYVMDTLEFTTELVEKKTEYVVPFTEDTTDYFIIGCTFNNFGFTTLSWCKFTRADGKVFKYSEGAATAYYSTFTTDFTDMRCSLEILKPLRAEDRGTWKCESDFGSGAFVAVETSTNFPYSKYFKKNVQLGQSFVVDCVVPYSTSYCYVVAPNGTQYKHDDIRQTTSGLCSLTVGRATPTDNGTWTCSVAQKNGIPDDVIAVDISIIELKILYADAEASEGDQVELICNTNGIPINSCRFVAPSGSAYTLRNDGETFNKISYKGRGLEYGDCGIQISKVSQKDSGQWRCYISPGRYDKDRADVSRKLDLNINSSVSTAESVGIAVGVLVVAIATAGFVFYKYSKRRSGRSQGVAQFTGRSSNGSGSSGEGVILAVSQNSYSYNTSM